MKNSFKDVAMNENNDKWNNVISRIVPIEKEKLI